MFLKVLLSGFLDGFQSCKNCPADSKRARFSPIPQLKAPADTTEAGGGASFRKPSLGD